MPGLWQARVIDLAGDTARIEVRQAHPDAGAFPDSHAFALRLLHEQAWSFDDSFSYRGDAPLGENVDNKQVYDEAWLAANVHRFIAGVTSEGDAGTIDERAAVRATADRLGLSTDLDELSDDERARFDEAYEAFWQDPTAMPARTYRITVTEPRFLAHLKPGTTWSSAAF